MNSADYTQLKIEYNKYLSKVKECEKKLYEIEKSITTKLKPICDTFCVFDNTYKISFMHSYVSILFISTNTFTVIIPYESINKIKTWNDLIKFKMKGKKNGS